MGPKHKSAALVNAQKALVNAQKAAREVKVELSEIESKIDEANIFLHQKHCTLNNTLTNIFEVDYFINKFTSFNELMFTKQCHLHEQLTTLFDLDGTMQGINLEIERKLRLLSRRKKVLTAINNIHNRTIDNKSAFTLTLFKKRKRSSDATTDDTGPQAKVARCNETFDVCSIIHGGTKKRLRPVLTGLMETLARKFPVKMIGQYLSQSKSCLSRNLSNVFVESWHSIYSKSKENRLRSLSIYYSHNVMGKRKYLAVRKANRNSTVSKKRLANFLSYKDLAIYISQIDIGCVYPIGDLLPTLDEKPSGMYRNVLDYIQQLAAMYLRLNYTREDKLLEFPNLPKKDPSSFLFAMSFGGDGAPGVGTVFSVNFLNVGKRISSSKETYVVFGGDVAEDALVVKCFLAHATKCFEMLESKVFQIEGRNVEFVLAELPNDMKMLAYLAGELSNSAKFFTTFADVNSANHRDLQQSFTIDGSKGWKPFSYERRVAHSKKVEVLKKDKKKLNPKNSEKTNRSKVTDFISNTLGSRQEVLPLVKRFINVAKAEALHLKNNTTKEYFIKTWKIIYDQCEHGKSVAYSKLAADDLFVSVVEYVKGEMKLNQLSKKMIAWFNETNRGIDKDFQFRFRGEESFGLLTYFAVMISNFLPLLKKEDSVKRLLQMHYQLILLRKVIAYSVRITNFTKSDLEDMKRAAQKLFRACCEFEPSTSPSLWVLCQVAPVHAELTLSAYGLGLGVNSMEAREQKHQVIKKYAENSTVQNKWEMVFRHEYLQCVFLREHGFDEVRYHNKGRCYLPDFSDGCCSACGLTLVNTMCPLCSHVFMVEIINSSS